jgi:hypothetical protein
MGRGNARVAPKGNTILVTISQDWSAEGGVQRHRTDVDESLVVAVEHLHHLGIRPEFSFGT